MLDPAACHPGLVPGSPLALNANILIAVDGNLKIHGVPAEKQMPIVKGDGRIASISAASILAKVFRDRYMDKLEEIYPGYGFDKHAGYGTKAHLDAIRRQGFTPAHRKSFHPKGLWGRGYTAWLGCFTLVFGAYWAFEKLQKCQNADFYVSKVQNNDFFT